MGKIIRPSAFFLGIDIFLQADTYRYTDAGTWSAPLHFIDANDDPPSSCDVEYSRDCGDTGCVVSAIKNYVHFNEMINLNCI